jgi:hypothetical protein
MLLDRLFCLIIFECILERSLSSIHISPTDQQLQYSFLFANHSSTSIERVKRRATSDPFRIHIHYDRSVNK